MKIRFSKLGISAGCVTVILTLLAGCGSSLNATGAGQSKTNLSASTPACSLEAAQGGEQAEGARGATLFEHRFGLTMAVPNGTTLSCAGEQTRLELPGGLSVVFSRMVAAGRPLAQALADLVVDFGAALPAREHASVHRFAMPNTPEARPVLCARSKMNTPARVQVVCFSGLAGPDGDWLVQLSAWTLGQAEFSAHESTAYALMRSLATGWELQRDDH